MVREMLRGSSKARRARRRSACARARLATLAIGIAAPDSCSRHFGRRSRGASELERLYASRLGLASFGYNASTWPPAGSPGFHRLKRLTELPSNVIGH